MEAEEADLKLRAEGVAPSQYRAAGGQLEPSGETLTLAVT